MIWPSASTRMREHSDITNSMLCSMTTNVAPVSLLIDCQALLEVGEHRQIDAAGRLVEEHEARTSHERHRAIEQLLLAIGEAAGFLLSQMPEPEELDHAFCGISGETGIVGRRRGGPMPRSLMCSWPARIRFSRDGQLREHLQQLESPADAHAG